MIRKTILLTLCASGLSISAALGFSTDPSSLARTFNTTSATTNAPIVVTATFTNGGGLAVRGFCYAEQIPSGLKVTAISLRLNGQSVTNYTFESGLVGDVYPGCTPHRWVLERPPDFAETNPVSANVTVEIQYSITSPVAGSFNLQQFSRIGYSAANTNAIFGHSEDSNAQSVNFSAGSPILITSTSAMNFIANSGTNPANQALGITNDGSGTLSWTAATGRSGPAWLTVNPTNGVGNAVINVSVLSASLSPGNYSKEIILMATGASNSPQTVMVSLTVTPPISMDPGEFVWLWGSPDGQVHLILRASAGQQFVIQASTNLASWNELGTMTMVGEWAEFVDVGATNHPHRYYRAKRF